MPCISAIGLDHITLTGAWTAGNDRNLEGMWEWADLISHVYVTIDEQVYANWPQTPIGMVLACVKLCSSVTRIFY